ncbi:hypothetical protein ASF23_16295 [Curtobacterium sp. Leaf261]|nr:hypothetical protein ASF23_16295 [Curtobacterium sp. Leaf261]
MRPTPDPSDFAPAGAWAHEFAEASSTAGPFERRILADGVITETEFEDSRTAMRRCMRDAGFAYTAFWDGGAVAAAAPGHRTIRDVTPVSDALRECSNQFGRSIADLFRETLRDPDKTERA